MNTKTMQRRDVLAGRSDEDIALASERTSPTEILLSAIRTNGSTQMRAALNQDTINEYAAIMDEAGGWGPFPPVSVFYDGAEYWLADGFHRAQAAMYRMETIPAIVKPGGQREAILHAAQANASHGLRRTNADKRRAVETLLRDDEWGQWSDRQIADKCKVSNRFVGIMRAGLAPVTVNDSQSEANEAPTPPTERTYTTKHGTTAKMNVNGQRKAAAARYDDARQRNKAEVWLMGKGWWLGNTPAGGLSVSRRIDGVVVRVEEATPAETISVAMARQKELIATEKANSTELDPAPRPLDLTETVAVIYNAMQSKVKATEGHQAAQVWLSTHYKVDDYLFRINLDNVFIDVATFRTAYERVRSEMGLMGSKATTHQEPALLENDDMRQPVMPTGRNAEKIRDLIKMAHVLKDGARLVDDYFGKYIGKDTKTLEYKRGVWVVIAEIDNELRACEWGQP